MKNKINNDDNVLNELALYFLLEYGRQKLKDDKSFNKLLDSIDTSPRSIFTPDYQKEALKQSKKFAMISPNDLYRYIQKEIPTVKEKKERDVR